MKGNPYKRNGSHQAKLWEEKLKPERLRGRTKVQTGTRRVRMRVGRELRCRYIGVRHKSRRLCPNGLEKSVMYRIWKLWRKQNPGCRKVSGYHISRSSMYAKR